MHKLAVLLVEDNPDHVELAIEALLQCGVERSRIQIAMDGEDALAYLLCTGRHRTRDIDAQPDVVLLDMHLPKIGGDEVLSRMRADPVTFFVPVVMFTDHDSWFASLQDFEGGLTSHSSKPITAATLAVKLAEIQDYWHTSRFSLLTA